MPRRSRPDKRVIPPDPRYGSKTVAMFVNKIMTRGKKSTAERIMYDALTRLEVTVSMAGFEIPMRALRQQICSALHLVIQAQRLMGGRRKITTVSEMTR